MTGGALKTCVGCGAKTRSRQVGATPIEVCVCRCCGLGRSHGAVRPDDYWAGATRRGEQSDRYWADARADLFRGALARLAELPGRRLLDVGGGVGHFARYALDAGWDAYSSDISPFAVSEAARRLGPERSLMGFPARLGDTFDVVTLWCVIAHVADPRPLLEEAVRCLRTGGTLLLTTPNFQFQTFYVRALARLGRSVDLREHGHVFHFTEAALSRLLADVGVTRPSYTYLGVTGECVAEPRLGPVLVPAKRAWNQVTVAAARVGFPVLSSELQVLATVG